MRDVDYRCAYGVAWSGGVQTLRDAGYPYTVTVLQDFLSVGGIPVEDDRAGRVADGEKTEILSKREYYRGGQAEEYVLPSFVQCRREICRIPDRAAILWGGGEGRSKRKKGGDRYSHDPSHIARNCTICEQYGSTPLKVGVEVIRSVCYLSH